MRRSFAYYVTQFEQLYGEATRLASTDPAAAEKKIRDAQRPLQRLIQIASVRAWQARHRGKVRSYARRAARKRLGIPDVPDPAAGTPCAICGATAEPLMVDHDHDTGGFRGFLCRRCNAGLGMFMNNPDWLRAAIRYLTRGE